MRRGFTIIELIVVVVVILVLFVVAGIIIPSQGKRHGGHHQLKDATQLRGIGQAMFIWAMNNDDKYPLPSVIDVNNATVAELGRAKDTTANIFSPLIDDGSVTAELCISPLENNERIVAYENYETEEPTAAIDPVKALWDPGFSADFTAEGGGNISYAHLIPVGERLDMWKITNKGDEAILSNRGPEMASINRADGNVVTGFTNPDTNTILFAGSKENMVGQHRIQRQPCRTRQRPLHTQQSNRHNQLPPASPHHQRRRHNNRLPRCALCR